MSFDELKTQHPREAKTAVASVVYVSAGATSRIPWTPISERVNRLSYDARGKIDQLFDDITIEPCL